jgi:hypothetical protein
MFDISSLKNDNKALKEQMSSMQSNMIHGMDLGTYIFDKVITRIDPVEYCQRVLRAHLPENKRYLHENQIELIRAVCNPRKFAA